MVLVKTKSYCTEPSCRGKRIRLIKKFKLMGINSRFDSKWTLYRYWREEKRGLIESFRLESEKVFCPHCKSITTKIIRKSFTDNEVTNALAYTAYYVTNAQLFEYNLSWPQPKQTAPKRKSRFTGIIYVFTPKLKIKNSAFAATQEIATQKGFIIMGKSIAALLGNDSKRRYFIRKSLLKGKRRRELYVSLEF